MRLLRAHEERVRQSREKLNGFRQGFEETHKHLQNRSNDLFNEISNLRSLNNKMRLDCMGMGDDQPMPDEFFLYEADLSAYTILTIKHEVESSMLQNFITLTTTCPPPTCRYSLWLEELSRLNRLAKLQFSFEATNRINLEDELLPCGQQALAQLESAYQIVTTVEALLIQGKWEVATLAYPGFPNLCALNNPDLSLFPDILKKLEAFKLTLYEKHALTMEGRMSQILSKFDKQQDEAKVKNKEASTRTSVTTKLFRFSPKDADSRADLTLYLITEVTARKIHNDSDFVSGTIPTTDGAIYASGPQVVGVVNNKKSIQATLTCKLDRLNVLQANVKSLSIIERQRPGSGNDSRVAKEKLCLLAITKLTVLALDGKTPVNTTAWALSEPIVVLSHSSHKAAALATISQDMYFSELLRSPFQVSKTAKFPYVMNVLQINFKEWTGLDLEGIRLQFLEDMLIQHVYGTEKAKDQTLQRDELDIPLEMLYWKTLSNRKFTMWSWLYKAAQIINRPYFKKLYTTGSLQAFVGKAKAEFLLLEMYQKLNQTGCFLVRFSESFEGEISITFVGRNQRGNIQVYFHLLEDLQRKSDEAFQNSFLRHLEKPLNVGGVVSQPFVFVYPKGCSTKEAFHPKENPKKKNSLENYNNRRTNSEFSYIYDRRVLTV